MSARQLASQNWCFAAGLCFALGLGLLHAKGTLMGWLQFFSVVLTGVFGFHLDSYRCKLYQITAVGQPLPQEGIK